MEATSNKTVCIIGAGFSGVGAAIKLKKDFKNINFTIFDENDDVGGTWTVHTYPNCDSDVPIHCYTFSFEQKSDWSTFFGSQKDIKVYFQQTCIKYDIYRHVKLNHQVVKLEWFEEKKQWMVSVREKSMDTVDHYFFDFVICGAGAFRRPNIPEIFRNFKGPVMHTSEWDDKVDFTDESVAIVGSGTSAIHVVPAVVSRAEKVYAFQRRPAWVIPKPAFSIPLVFHWIFEFVPFILTLWRSFIFLFFEIAFFAFKHNSLFNRIGRWISNIHLKRQVNNNLELIEKLTPDYPFACKRMGLSNEYWKSLAQPHVKVIRSTIENVTENSIMTSDGQEYKVNIIILATGYDVQKYLDPIEFIGINKKAVPPLNSLQHYLGIVSHSAPNFFLLLGPNTGVLHSTNIFNVECQINWICTVLDKMLKKGYSRAQVKRSAEIEYIKFTDEEMKPLVYTMPECSSWYVNSNGRVNALHSNNCITYWNRTRNVDFSKLELS